MSVLETRKLSVHEEMEVERRFYRLLQAGYIPEGLEDAFLAKMLQEKVLEVEQRLK